MDNGLVACAGAATRHATSRGGGGQYDVLDAEALPDGAFTLDADAATTPRPAEGGSSAIKRLKRFTDKILCKVLV